MPDFIHGSHRSRPALCGLAAACALAWLSGGVAFAQDEEEVVPRPMFIRQYRVKGAKELPAAEVQDAVYPYLGPGRLPADVDQARAALEKLYHDKGYRMVSVIIPQQRIRKGVVMLQVEENPVGRVRVTGGSFTSPSKLKAAAPSLQEGRPIHFDKLTGEIVGMNQTRNRRVKPDVRQGAEPGYFDVLLEVEDELPLHGSLELNNRYSVGTSPLRLNASLSYENLWQLDHTLGVSYQVAPEMSSESQVFSAYYLAPFRRGSGWSVMLQGTTQDSDVSTLGGLAVVGRGDVFGLRLMRNLPMKGKYYHSISLGGDYKRFDQTMNFGTGKLSSPVSYFPFTVQYNGGMRGEKSVTSLAASTTWGMRGWGSSTSEFNSKRYGADSSFIYARADVSHTRDLDSGWQWFARAQGQASSQPLVDSEQFAAGGLGTIRGYLESEALGDDALVASFELRGPSLTGSWAREDDEWRVYGFIDAGVTRIQQPLPGQKRSETLSGIGLGTRGRLFDHFNGSLDLSYPLLDRPTGLDRRPMYTFRLWGDF